MVRSADRPDHQRRGGRTGRGRTVSYLVQSSWGQTTTAEGPPGVRVGDDLLRTPARASTDQVGRRLAAAIEEAPHRSGHGRGVATDGNMAGALDYEKFGAGHRVAEGDHGR